MEQNWSEYEGLSVCGWNLQSFLGSRGARGFYVARHDNGSAALIQIIPIGDVGAEAARHSWRRAAALSYEGLVRLYETGETELAEGVPLYYAAMELPDDDVGELSDRRVLTDAEIRSVNEAIAGALQDLHANGIAHGAVEPSNMFIVDGAYKLSVDTLTQASPERVEDDMRGLAGMTRMPEGRIEPPSITGHKRWFIAAACGVAVLLLFTILLARSTRHSRETRPVRAAAVAAPRTPRADPFQKVSPAGVTRASLAETDTADRSVELPPDRRRWSVVAATYAAYTAAAKRSEAMRKRWPDLHPSVFPEDGEGNLYFVVLGAKQSKDGAVGLRQQAVSEGVAPDVYATILLKR